MRSTALLLKPHPLAMRAGAALLLGAGLVLGSAAPAYAQVNPPAGCPPIPGGYTIDDHRNDATSIGVAGTPYAVVGGSNVYTIGTPFDDFISGNANDDIICALGGADTVDGHSGDDDIYGLGGRDTLSGNEFRDTLTGGDDGDTLYGDGLTPSVFDLADQLRGGQGNDRLFGGDGLDDMRGNTNTDTGDGEGAGGVCDVSVEQKTNC
jgi:Ca2+-binding RTX toxin-like protein